MTRTGMGASARLENVGLHDAVRLTHLLLQLEQLPIRVHRFAPCRARGLPEKSPQWGRHASGRDEGGAMLCDGSKQQSGHGISCAVPGPGLHVWRAPDRLVWRRRGSVTACATLRYMRQSLGTLPGSRGGAQRGVPLLPECLHMCTLFCRCSCECNLQPPSLLIARMSTPLA